MRQLLVGFLLAFCCNGFAANNGIELEKANVNSGDLASIKRGADFYAKNCLTCHSLKYMRYNKIAQDAGITYDKMPTKDQEWWFGVAPPDLSLITRAKGPDWVYTYLLSFYQDTSTTLGTNNLLLPNVSMPNPFLGLQGEQRLIQVSREKLLTHGFNQNDPNYYNVLELVKQGTMTPADFDKSINDLVNFLAYTAEPMQNQRKHIGFWVIGFLIIFAILAYLLKKEFWRDV